MRINSFNIKCLEEVICEAKRCHAEMINDITIDKINGGVMTQNNKAENIAKLLLGKIEALERYVTKNKIKVPVSLTEDGNILETEGESLSLGFECKTVDIDTLNCLSTGELKQILDSIASMCYNCNCNC